MGQTYPSKTKEVIVLTEREVDVLRLVAQGHTAKEVAEVLGIARKTVDTHLGKAYDKLGVSNRMQAVNKAREHGLL